MLRKSASFLFLLFLTFPLVAENGALNYLNRILNLDEGETEKSLSRMAGGTALLTDDPANYAIYEKLEAYIKSFDRQIANQADLLSFYNVEDSALGSLTDVLQRIRELLVEKNSGLLAASDRDIIDSEISQMADQLVETLKETEFNTKKVLSNLLSDPVVVQAIAEPTHYTLDGVDNFLTYIETQRASVGASSNALQFGMAGNRIAEENTQKTQSHGDTDFATESVRLKRSQVLMMADLLMLKRK